MAIEQNKNVNDIMKIALLFEKGHKQDIMNFVNKIETSEKFETLPQALQDVYEKVGQTPIEEPELYEISERIAKSEGSIVEIAMKVMTDDEVDEYSIEDIGFLCGEINRKVRYIKDKSGVFKSTPNTEDWQPPKPTKLFKYKKVIDNITEAEKSGDVKKAEEANAEKEKFLFKSCGIDADKLSVWEKALVTAQTEEAFTGGLNSFLGKR